MVDLKLKEINYNGIPLYYKRDSFDTDFGTAWRTDFYLTNSKTKTVQKYILFGPFVEVFDNEKVFTLNMDI
jgi:hypothetical protein